VQRFGDFVRTTVGPTPAALPFTTPVSVMARWGAGSRDLPAAMRPKAVP
jgi:hypothetical protein